LKRKLSYNQKKTMKITKENYGQAVILVCSGELTDDSLDAFRHAVEQIKQRNDEGSDQPDAVADLVLDFEAVPFIDSAGLEYLLDLQEKFAEKLGRIKLANLNENIAEILKITRLDNAFERFKDVPDAVKAV